MDFCAGLAITIFKALRDTTFQKPFQDSMKIIFEKSQSSKIQIFLF